MLQHSGIRFLITLLSISAVFASCKEEKVKSKLSYDNNNESMAWTQSPAIIKTPEAHSGNYVCKIDKGSPYSSVLNVRVKDISDKQLKKARISAWFMLTSNASEQGLVLDIRDSTGQNSLEWLGVDAADFTTEVNKWARAELVVDLTQKDRNNKGKLYRIYALNNTDAPVFVDDFEVNFEE